MAANPEKQTPSSQDGDGPIAGEGEPVSPESQWPGDIKTEPNAKIVYNAPFSEKNVYNVRLTNNGAHRIGWATTTTNTRLAVDPPAGCLDVKEGQMLTIACEPFTFSALDPNDDRISFKWTNAPDGAAKQCHAGWFQGDGMVRRKNLSIEYNP